MKIILQLEQAGLLIAAVCFCYVQPVTMPWYVWFLLFFSPDISMLGYAAGTKTGAFFYNLFHHQGLAALLMMFGHFIQSPVLILAGLLLIAHSAFDRVMGYGLKYQDSFKHTHLGTLGAVKSKH